MFSLDVMSDVLISWTGIDVLTGIYVEGEGILPISHPELEWNVC